MEQKLVDENLYEQIKYINKIFFVLENDTPIYRLVNEEMKCQQTEVG